MRTPWCSLIITSVLLAVPASAEEASFAPPAGWILVEDAETEFGISHRMVPEGQSLESWTSQIHLMSFDTFALLLTPGEVLKDSQEQMGRACPEIAPTQVEERGEGATASAFVRLDCPRNARTGKPLTMLMLVRTDFPALRLRQVLFNHVPTDEEARFAREFIEQPEP